MADIYDDLFLHMITMMLIAFKVVGFITWSWWLVGSPSIVALFLYIYSVLSSR